jgi:2-oxoisovalerate dehydrogenase E2 component (dihydrolipoyl transacylase)
MGARSIRMPDVGEGVAEAEIVEWSVKVGDLVREDQVVAAVMTDKATVEIPTPVAGTVLALGGEVGDVLAVGSELIRIDAPGMPDSPPPAPRKAPAAKAEQAAPAAAPQRVERPHVDEEPRVVPSTMPQSPIELMRPAPPPTGGPPSPLHGAPRAPGDKPIASPAVRLKAREAGVDLRFVHGSGPAGLAI